MSTSDLIQSRSCDVGIAQSACPLCSGLKGAKVLVSGPRRRLLQCRTCSVIFLDPPPDRRELTRLLVDHYIKDEARLERAFQRTRESVFARIAAKIQQQMKGGRILDVGCAGGYFLERYFSIGWERFGIEPSRYGAAKAAEKGIQLYQGQLLEVVLPDRFFDVVTLLDTLCYMQEPLRELRRLRQALKPEGLLIVQLPVATTHIWRHATRLGRFLGGAPMSLLESGQMYLHGKQSMDFVLRESGFAIVEYEPLPGNRQRQSYRNLEFESYYQASRLLWYLSAGKWMLGPNFLAVASPALDG